MPYKCAPFRDTLLLYLFFFNLVLDCKVKIVKYLSSVFHKISLCKHLHSRCGYQEGRRASVNLCKCNTMYFDQVKQQHVVVLMLYPMGKSVCVLVFKETVYAEKEVCVCGLLRETV